ncbi:putative DNA polymerase processivity factor [Parapoxvirus red deer/HL953]|uniref:Putative DNA polymerase processivity factor n=1 Tax=Parapoxvirus red deer/HL953 TaxID=1579460 RepID=A0A0A7MA09_9POXV|nr:putative DNA polymerase processivity factor [Parapoxvirus red deer/HL953]AIZ77349.1 putative DNA polymerase processivity factor [Parapoxvirus red deer/HL953]
MTSESDLVTLKELIRLRDSLHLVTGAAVDRYNALVEWANRTYWTVAVAPSAPCASVEKYYCAARSDCALEPGEYVVSRVHFGATHAWVRGAVFDSASGAEVEPPPEVRAACAAADARFADLTFVRFAVFRQVWVADDAVAEYAASDEVLAELARAGVRTARTLRLAVRAGERFAREDFEAVHRALVADGDAAGGTAVCMARPGVVQRRLVDCSQRCFMRVRRLDLVSVDARHHLPVLRGAGGARVLCRGVGHLVDARAREGVFVAVRRYADCLVLCDGAAKAAAAECSREEALRAVVRCLGADCAVSNGYVIHVRDTDVRGMAARLGIVAPCAGFEALRDAILADCALARRLRDGGAIRMACECMGYPHRDAVELINNMRFQITDEGAVRAFELDNAACLANPTAESIFASFPQFVSVFNVLSAALRRAE